MIKPQRRMTPPIFWAKEIRADGNKESPLFWILLVIFIISIFVLITFWPSKAIAQDWTDQQIVEAIYKAEGGKKAKYAYGIRSVHYNSIAEAKRICLRTVHNNRARWEKAGRQVDFLSFLANRYAPTKNCDNDPRGLNNNWKKNVEYFLNKQKN